MQKLLISLVFVLLIFNYSLAQLKITQKGDDIIIENTTDFSTEVFISESAQGNFLLRPNQNRIISLNKFLTEKSLEEIKISSFYTFEAYLADTRSTIFKTRDEVNNNQIYKEHSLEWKSITDLLRNSQGDDEKDLNEIISSFGLVQNFNQKNKSKYETFVQLIEKNLIPNNDHLRFTAEDDMSFPSKVNESQITLAKGYIFDFLNIEIDTDDTTEINLMADFYNRVKSIKKNYESSSIIEYGTLKDLGFKVFENSDDRYQVSFVFSGIAPSFGTDNGQELIYNFNPEIGIRTGRLRVGKNLMIENNVNIGYSYYAFDRLDQTIVIGDVVNEIDYVYDKYHMATLGLDLILKGGIQKPSLLGIGAEGGATYLISNSYNIRPIIELTPEADTDLGYYFGGFVMIGDKLNVKLGFRTYVVWYTPQEVDRNYLNTGLARISVSYRF